MKFNKIYEFKAGNDGILSILINNEILYACGEDNFIRSFNISNYRKINEVNAHSKDVLKIILSPCKKYIFSTSRDGYIKQWDLNLNLVYEYEPHNSDVNLIDFIDEKTFISCSDDSTVRVYKITSKSYKEINPQIGDVNTLKVTKNYIYLGGSKLQILNKDFKKIKEDDDYIYGINLIKNNNNFVYVSRSMEKSLEIWDEEKLERIKKIKISSWINDIFFYEDKIFIANSNIISVFDKNMNLIAENDYHQDEVYSIEIYDGKLITASNDSYIRIWEINN
jgi:WD40 repeat protein